MLRLQRLLAVTLLAVSCISTSVFGQKILGVYKTKPEVKIIFENEGFSATAVSLDGFQAIFRSTSVSKLQILERPKILESLDLSDLQKELLKDIQKRVKERRETLTANFKARLEKEGSTKGKVKVANDLMKEMSEFEEEIAKEIEEELIPHQSNLFERQSFQELSKFQGFTRALLTKPFDDELKIKAKQRKEIAKIEKAANEELEKQRERIKADVERKVRRLLDAEQKKKLNVLEEPLG